MKEETRISSPGKVNLFLDLTRQREDGYHELFTLFVPTENLKDELIIRSASEMRILCEHPGVPCGPANLVYKAAELFAEASAIDDRWEIEILKKLPVAGGMGGGSSDAGATLLALNERYDFPLTKDKLAELALRIGADVPFFLNPKPSLARGVGEELEEIFLPKQYLVLVTFDFPISAIWAYKNKSCFLDVMKDQQEAIYSGEALKTAEGIAPLVYNGLAISLYKKFPILGMVRPALSDSGALAAALSGSGPPVFALCSSQKQAEEVLEKFTAQDLVPEESCYIVSTEA